MTPEMIYKYRKARESNDLDLFIGVKCMCNLDLDNGGIIAVQGTIVGHEQNGQYTIIKVHFGFSDGELRGNAEPNIENYIQNHSKEDVYPYFTEEKKIFI